LANAGQLNPRSIDPWSGELDTQWSEEHKLLLVYKDDLAKQKGLFSSAQMAESETIQLHIAASTGISIIDAQPGLFPATIRYNERHSTQVDPKCCV